MSSAIVFRDVYWTGNLLKKGARGRRTLSVRVPGPTEDAAAAFAELLGILSSPANFNQPVLTLAILDATGRPGPPLTDVATVIAASSPKHSGGDRDPSRPTTVYVVLPSKGDAADVPSPRDVTSSPPWAPHLTQPPSLTPNANGNANGNVNANGHRMSLPGKWSDLPLLMGAPSDPEAPPLRAAKGAPESAGRVTRLEALAFRGQVASAALAACALALVIVVAWLGAGMQSTNAALSTAQAQIASLQKAAGPSSPSTSPTPASSTPASTTPAASTPAISTPASTTPPGPGTGAGLSTLVVDPASGQALGDNYGGGPAFGQDLGRGVAGTYQFRSDDLYVGRGYSDGAKSPGSPGIVRTYYVACQERRWDYGVGVSNDFSSGPRRDVFYGEQIPAPYYPRGTDKAGWLKKQYVGYTDGTYTTEIPLPAWAGYMGPIIRGVVGDTILVNYFNNCTIDTTIHAHGMNYDLSIVDPQGASEGAWQQYAWDGPGTGNDVRPGDKTMYTWRVSVKSGPVGAGVDFSSQAWWYHSHIFEGGEVNLGLHGFIIVTARGWEHPDGSGRPKDVDQEFILWLSNVKESGKTATGVESGTFYCINGKIFGNAIPYSMRLGDRVRWYIMGIGDEQDLHTVHFHLNAVTYRGTRTDIVELLPGSMTVADMHADGVGWWFIHCHVETHLNGGMVSSYYIGPPPGNPTNTNGSMYFGNPSVVVINDANFPLLYQLPANTQAQFGFTSYSTPPRNI